MSSHCNAHAVTLDSVPLLLFSGVQSLYLDYPLVSQTGKWIPLRSKSTQLNSLFSHPGKKISSGNITRLTIIFLYDKCPFFSLGETQLFCYTQKKCMICFINGFNPQPSESSSFRLFPTNWYCTFKKKQNNLLSEACLFANDVESLWEQNIAKDQPWDWPPTCFLPSTVSVCPFRSLTIAQGIAIYILDNCVLRSECRKWTWDRWPFILILDWWIILLIWSSLTVYSWKNTTAHQIFFFLPQK